MEDSWPAISESDLYDPWVALSDLHEKVSSDQLEFLGPELIFKAVAVGDPEKIDKLSQRLLREMAQRRERIQAGETALVRRGLALADSEVSERRSSPSAGNWMRSAMATAGSRYLRRRERRA